MVAHFLRSRLSRKAIAKSQSLRLHGGFIHTLFIRTTVSSIQEVSGLYTSQFLDTDQSKMALRARKVGAFKTRAHGLPNRRQSISDNQAGPPPSLI